MSATTFVEIITIGREILDGRIVDTNSVWIAQKLKERGLMVRYAQKVDDEIERITEAFDVASKRSKIILVTGGLGPTADDLTAEAFAKFQHSNLELNKEAEKILRNFLDKRNKPMTDSQLKQAYLPEGVTVIENINGTASSFSFHERTRNWYFMPGVPFEMKALFEDKILPELPVDKGYKHYHWITQFTSESQLQQLLADTQKKLKTGFEIGFRTRFPDNFISLFASCSKPEDEILFETLKTEINSKLESDCYSQGENPKSLEEHILSLAKAKNAKIAFVESCTGGLNAHRITDVAGASEVLMASWVTYDNLAKIKLGVSEKVITKHGAVSKECAEEMAKAGLSQLQEMFPNNLCICISTTGIAGPSGGTKEKPVGLCYSTTATADPKSKELEVKTQKIQAALNHSRSSNKLYFSQKSLTPLL